MRFLEKFWQAMGQMLNLAPKQSAAGERILEMQRELAKRSAKDAVRRDWERVLGEVGRDLPKHATPHPHSIPE